MAGTTALIFFDFAWFREQTCLVACPYGRLQSVLLDRQSLIVGYDVRRGEPRSHRRRSDRARGQPATASTAAPASLTCPTGIDIRDGLQMECIHCTQCADACDAVMAKIEQPAGADPLHLARRARGQADRHRSGRASCSIRSRSPSRVGLPRRHARHQGRHRRDAPARRSARRSPGSRTAGRRTRSGSRSRTARAHARRYRLELDGVPGGATVIAPQNPLPVRGAARRRRPASSSCCRASAFLTASAPPPSGSPTAALRARHVRSKLRRARRDRAPDERPRHGRGEDHR